MESFIHGWPSSFYNFSFSWINFYFIFYPNTIVKGSVWRCILDTTLGMDIVMVVACFNVFETWYHVWWHKIYSGNNHCILPFILVWIYQVRMYFWWHLWILYHNPGRFNVKIWQTHPSFSAALFWCSILAEWPFLLRVAYCIKSIGSYISWS